MQKYVSVIKGDNSISVCLYIEGVKLMRIGEKMEKINPEAYMNGYNWEAFLGYYLEKYEPDLLEGMDTDPEAGMYCAYYDLSAENEEKADRFAKLLEKLVEEEDELYRIVRDEGDEIEWD